MQNPGSSPDNPFRAAGALPPDHPAYVTRACDAALENALRTEPLISLEGDFGIGKSSLAVKAHARLAATHVTCHVNMAELGTDAAHILLRSFFEELGSQIGRKVDGWPMLNDDELAPLALIIDELGCLSARTAPTFVPPLVNWAIRNRNRTRVIVCLPVFSGSDSIGRFLEDRGVQNVKHQNAWHQIHIPLLDAGGLECLFALLPPRARALAHQNADNIARLSGGHPMAVQRLCSALFDADASGALDVDLKVIIGAEGSYT